MRRNDGVLYTNCKEKASIWCYIWTAKQPNATFITHIYKGKSGLCSACALLMTARCPTPSPQALKVIWKHFSCTSLPFHSQRVFNQPSKNICLTEEFYRDFFCSLTMHVHELLTHVRVGLARSCYPTMWHSLWILPLISIVICDVACNPSWRDSPSMRNSCLIERRVDGNSFLMLCAST